MKNINKKSTERMTQKKPGKKYMQEARIAVLKDLQNRLEAKQSLIKLRQEMAKYHKPQDTIKPIPSSMKQAFEEHHKKVEKIKSDARERLPLSFATQPDEWTKKFYSGFDRPCDEQAIEMFFHLGCDQSNFDILTQTGIADAFVLDNNQQVINNVACKTASGYAGTAAANALSPDYSHIIFGFWTHFQIPVDGEPFRVRIWSGTQVDFGWLEAMSIVPGSQGQVEVWTNRYLFYADQANRVDSQLIIGVSPPPAGPGHSGVWHPVGVTANRGMTLNFDIHDRDANRWLSIFETIEIVAIRIGDVNNCNAVASCNVNFSPLSIAINNCTHTPLP